MIKIDSITFAKVLADETRQKIMKLICCQWLSVNEIVDCLNVTQPTVSHHLTILRDANMVHYKEDGKLTYYTLNKDLVTSCCDALIIKFSSSDDDCQCC